MGFFTVQTARVDIDAKHYAIVKKLSYGEIADCTSLSSVIDETAGVLRINPISFQKELLARSVIEWDGPDFEGRPATRENVLALPSLIARPIREKAEEINREMTEEEGNASAAPTSS